MYLLGGTGGVTRMLLSRNKSFYVRHVFLGRGWRCSVGPTSETTTAILFTKPPVGVVLTLRHPRKRGTQNLHSTPFSSFKRSNCKLLAGRDFLLWPNSC